MSSTWTNQATRVTTNSRESNATRTQVCFEVLDYDSLTYVKVEDKRENVVALIYKKVTIAHRQNRKYDIAYTNTAETNIKDNKMETRPLWELDAVPATDDYSYSGTRKVDYILCLLVGATKYTIALGTVNIGVSGKYNLSGPNKNHVEGNASLLKEGPTFTVTGNRLYGVNVSCGQEAVTYTYDVEEFKGPVTLQQDSPVNIEDYNEYWKKNKRVIGAMNYKGIKDSKDFACSKFSDTVLAVNYYDKSLTIGG